MLVARGRTVSLLPIQERGRELQVHEGSQGFGTSQSQSVAGQVEDTVRSSTARCRPQGPVSVSGSYRGTPHFTSRPEGPEYG